MYSAGPYISDVKNACVMANIFNEPVCLIETNAEGNLEVSKNVARQIRDIDKELVVVAIAGKYRTGKSYLMNRLAEKNKGFPLGSTIESKTKGIWVWCRQHPVKRDSVLMLLDTEGIGDVHKVDADNHDNSMLTLAVLLCSTFVYNILSVFNEEALSRLHFVSQIAGKISTSHFPTFVLAVRDFCLLLQKDGQPMTRNEYLEYSLSVANAETSNRDYTTSRDAIRTCFKTRTCFTFERPGTGKQLVKLESLTDADLDPAFLEETRAFLEYIFQEAPVKTQNGIHVTGEVMTLMIEHYLLEINNGTVPNVDNVFRTLEKMKNMEASKQSIAIYISWMDQLVQPPIHQLELDIFHQQCMQMARETFYQVLGQIKPIDNVLLENKIQIVKYYSKLETNNLEESRKGLSKLLEKMYTDVTEEMSNGRYHRSRGHRNYQFHMKQLKENFLFCVRGLPGKPVEVFEQFITLKEGEEQSILHSDHSIAETERKTMEEQKRARQVERNCERYALERIRLTGQMEQFQATFQEKSEEMRCELQEEELRQRRQMDDRFCRRRDELRDSSRRQEDRLRFEFQRELKRYN